MFVESLLESGHPHPKGRGWATTLSITLQGLLLAALVALPIFRPDRLQLEMKSITSPIAFGRLDAPSQPSQQRSAAAPSPTTTPVLTQPREIPTSRPTGLAPQSPSEVPPIPCAGNCSLPVGDGAGIPHSIGLSVLSVTPPVRPPERRVVSQIALGRLVDQVQPVYPPMAVRIRLEGTVVLRALVGRDGRISSVQVLSGHPFLVDSARAAVSQWRYRPYLLNGQPIEVETQITVNYKMAH